MVVSAYDNETKTKVSQDSTFCMNALICLKNIATNAVFLMHVLFHTHGRKGIITKD